MVDDIKKKPDFIGVGVAKAATTWIFMCLQDHPEICASNRKETNFFSRNYHKGINHYLSFFKECPPNKICGEFTPHYILYPQVAELIYKHFPDIKIIFCLRHPADVLYSHYNFNLEIKGRFSIYNSFEDAIKKDPTFLGIGFYYKRLKRYFDLFPKEKILVLFYEDIKRNPREFMRKAYSFLELRNIDYIPSIINEKQKTINVVKSKIPIINSLIYWMRKYIINTKFEILLNKLRLSNLLVSFVFFNRKTLEANPYDKKSSYQFTIKEKTKTYLSKVYAEDISKLKILLNRDTVF